MQLHGANDKVQLFKTSACYFSRGAFFSLRAKIDFVYFTVPVSKGLLRKFGAVEVPDSLARVETGSAQVAFQFIYQEGATTEEDMKASQGFDVFLRPGARFVGSKQYRGHLARLAAHPWQYEL